VVIIIEKHIICQWNSPVVVKKQIPFFVFLFAFLGLGGVVRGLSSAVCSRWISPVTVANVAENAFAALQKVSSLLGDRATGSEIRKLQMK
jgi:hypothetical protein